MTVCTETLTGTKKITRATLYWTPSSPRSSDRPNTLAFEMLTLRIVSINSSRLPSPEHTCPRKPASTEGPGKESHGDRCARAASSPSYAPDMGRYSDLHSLDRLRRLHSLPGSFVRIVHRCRTRPTPSHSSRAPSASCLSADDDGPSTLSVGELRTRSACHVRLRLGLGLEV